MYSEKIKINVTKRIYTIILKDAEGFEFFRKDGRTLNKNALMSELIVNYFETFRERQSSFREFLTKTISRSVSASKSAVQDLCSEIAGYVNKTSSPGREKFDCTLNFKPTKQTQPIIDYIETCLLSDCSVSEYFRNMFTSYAQLPQDEREKIIFRSQFSTINSAIKNKNKIFITLNKKGNNKFEVSPYSIAESKEEMHCYLLAAADSKCFPIRISRILSVTETCENAEFSDEQTELFGRMIKYGPEFTYAPGEGEVMVRLTARGIEKFSKIYVHRPIPDKIVDNCYYFNCSYMQLIHYFVRFGKDAFVVYPEYVRNEIIGFYTQARTKYLLQIRKK